MRYITVQLPEEKADALKAYAKSQCETQATIIRTAISLFLREHQDKINKLKDSNLR